LAGPAVGTRPLTVAAATVAVSGLASGADPGLRLGARRRLTFGGEPEVRIAPGQRLTSDPVALAVPPDHDLAVSLWFAAPTGPPAAHAYAAQTSWVGPGKLVDVDSGSELRRRGARPTVAYPFAPSYVVTGVDVLTRGTAGVV